MIEDEGQIVEPLNGFKVAIYRFLGYLIQGFTNDIVRSLSMPDTLATGGTEI